MSLSPDEKDTSKEYDISSFIRLEHSQEVLSDETSSRNQEQQNTTHTTDEETLHTFRIKGSRAPGTSPYPETSKTSSLELCAGPKPSGMDETFCHDPAYDAKESWEKLPVQYPSELPYFHPPSREFFPLDPDPTSNIIAKKDAQLFSEVFTPSLTSSEYTHFDDPFSSVPRKRSSEAFYISNPESPLSTSVRQIQNMINSTTSITIGSTSESRKPVMVDKMVQTNLLEAPSPPSSREFKPEDQKRYKCSSCEKMFNRPSSLKTHMYSHTGEKPYACQMTGCHKKFSVLSNLRRHLKIHLQNSRLARSTSPKPSTNVIPATPPVYTQVLPTDTNRPFGSTHNHSSSPEPTTSKNANEQNFSKD
ncbi:hypothetical protein K7432_012078 [Basidiobolus ranarum]|uniref:C2H2-type domain-containing protein n=1 Tax=Basidiobolus ranarum TaxID=34480 RepID=A0ABR2WLE3_9FUNG